LGHQLSPYNALVKWFLLFTAPAVQSALSGVDISQPQEGSIGVSSHESFRLIRKMLQTLPALGFSCDHCLQTWFMVSNSRYRLRLPRSPQLLGVSTPGSVSCLSVACPTTALTPYGHWQVFVIAGPLCCPPPVLVFTGRGFLNPDI